MKTQTFDIRVALLGFVSAGKSTVLNAMLQNKYSEVAMHRTTAGVNSFRLYTKSAPAKDGSGTAAAPMDENDTMDWSPDPDELHTPEQTLLQIASDNAKLRQTNAIQETTFNVEVDEPLCDMRKDTRLVLIDIPGLNEAGSKEMYRDYVMEKWDSFDCAVVVMDVSQGVNTEEQVQLLEILHRKKSESKDIPVIVLCNKVDDPDNKEVMGFVKKVERKVHSIFQNAASVRFVPISAGNAFVYRAASRLNLEEFEKLDESLVDKIVCEEVGKSKWRKITVAERYRAAYDAVSNMSVDDGSLEATNFHTFIEVFRRCVGEPEQLGLIQKQLDVGLKGLTFDIVVAKELRKICDMNAWLGMPATNYKEHFWSLYNKYSDEYRKAFIDDLDHHGLQTVMLQLVEYGIFLQSMENEHGELSKVIGVMESLISTQVRHVIESSQKSNWLTSSDCATKPLYDWEGSTKSWRETTSPYGTCSGTRKTPPDNSPHHWKRVEGGWENVHSAKIVPGKHHPVIGPLTWAKLSPLDFCTISQSILLLSFSKSFNLFFGRERMLLEGVVNEFHGVMQTLETKYDSLVAKQPANACSYCYQYGNQRCHYCGKKNGKDEIPKMSKVLTEFTKRDFNDKNELVPKCPGKYAAVAQIEMPKRLSDPNHWGHLAWQFCEFMDAHDAKVGESSK